MVRGTRDPLQEIPGVGPSLARDLRDLGYERVEDLVGEDPDGMYARLVHVRGVRQDPCVLYVFRCAVYFASAPEPDPQLLKWWAWKGRDLPVEMSPGALPPSGGGASGKTPGAEEKSRSP
jgi:hypothetical protein